MYVLLNYQHMVSAYGILLILHLGITSALQFATCDMGI